MMNLSAQNMIPPFPPFLVRNVMYPLYRAVRGDRLLAHLTVLERNQWLSPGEIEEIQWNRLSDFLHHIARHVPYYRDIFGELGLGPDDIRSPADFEQLPFLTKEIIRQAGDRIITTDPKRKGYSSSTGGSTGEPLYFYIDKAAGPARRANTLRAFRWIGIDAGDWQAHISGFPLDIPWKERFVSGVRNFFNNMKYLSSFNMSEPTMQSFATMLKRYKPDLLIGYPSALTVFAEFCRSRSMSGIHPRAIISGGEKMYPHQKKTLESVFDAPVFDRYGSNEFANVAQECAERNGLHMFNDMMYIEIIHESGRPCQSGEVGEIVITDFLNPYMPFVRYRTGDLAVPTDRVCTCGRGFTLLDRIEGRTFDTIVMPDGRSIGGYFWTYLSRVVPGIKQFQVEQRDRRRIVYRIVPGPEWKNESPATLAATVKEQVGPGVDVSFDIVDEIPLSPAGKFKFIVSSVEERLVVKSKIHKATVTGEAKERIDCVFIDEELLELSNISPCEKVLIVDNTNGARIETFVMLNKRGSGEIVMSGAAASSIHTGDEVIIMAFTWSEETNAQFKNILVDENNRFVRYLSEVAGDKI
jgi:phenylacetate-CoA ligase